MVFRDNKKKLILGIVIAMLLSVTLGYAYLTQSLNINGNTTIKDNSWIIYFDNIVEKNNSVTASTPAVIIDEAKTKINFAVDLKDPGDKYEFVVDIKNDGTLDAMIDDVIKEGITDSNESFLDFDVSYLDGTKIRKCDLLKANSQRKVKVVAKFKEYYDSVSELPTDVSTTELGFEIDYIQAGKTCQIDDETEVVPTPQPEKHKLTIDPNGGVYAKGNESETNESFELTLEPGEEYTLHRFSRDGFELVLDLSEVTEYNEATRVITMANRDILIKPEWNLVDLTGVVAKNVDTGKYYPTINSAFVEAKNNETIELLKDTEEDPVNNTNGAITLDLGGYKVTGTLTNNKTLTLLNGTVENLDGIGAINNGTLTLGKNDGTVLVDEEGTIALIGSSTEGIGLQNNGTFNFYDGYLEAKVGLTGGYDNIPEEWYVYVNHNDIKNCQKVHLTQDVSRAVAKTVFEGVATRYFNLQDAFNSGMEEDLDVYAIRDFEAPYELHIDENEELLFDLAGFVVNTGNSITNSGTFTMTDTGRKTIVEGEEQTIKGELKPSKSITNNGTLNITSVKITSTSDTNTITNSKNLILTGDTITALAGYAIYNTGIGSVSGTLDNLITSNNYGLYNNASNGSISVGIISGTVGAIYNENKLTINDGTKVEVSAAKSGLIYGVYNNGSEAVLTMNDGIINVTNEGSIYSNCAQGIKQSNATTNLYGGELNVVGCYYSSTGISSGTVNVTGGNITSPLGIEGVVNYQMSGGKIISSNTGIKPYMSVQSVVITGGEIESESTGINQGGWGTYTIDGLKITAGETCIDLDITTMTINSGTYNCGASGINTRRRSNVTINGGTFTTVGDGIVTNGDNPTITITGGSIVSGGNYGINQKVGTVVVGKNDDTVSVDSPLIQGTMYGWYISGGTAKFYDGVLKGQTDGYYGLISSYPEGYDFKKETEIIQELEYQKVYLNSYINFVKVGETEYNSLSRALSAIDNTGTIELITDAEISEATFPSGKNITFDLAGHTLTINKQIINNGDLEIIDSTDEKNGGIVCSIENCIQNNGDLNLVNGSYSNSRNVIYNTNNLVINDGVNIIVTDDYNSDLSALYNYGSSAKITMNGGLIKVTNNSTHYASSAIGVVQSNSLFELTGGTIELISSVDSAGIVEGTVDFSGGTIKAANGLSDNREITMSGGKIISSSIGINPNTSVQSVVITGGEIESESTGIYQGGWGTYTIGGLKITASGVCFDLDITTITINSGTYDCGAGGINTRRGSNVTINGGTFTTVGNGIVTNGDNPTITITGGSIVSGGNYGIYQKVGTVVVGKNDDTVSVDSPLIQGSIYGWNISSGTANFYDGILKGQTDGYSGLISSYPDGYDMKHEEETIQNVDYQAVYFVPYINFVKVGETEYNSLNKAISAIEETGTIELISTAVISEATFPSGKNITFDLTGHTLTVNNQIINNADLEIIDSTDEKNGGIVCSIENCIQNNGDLNLVNGSYSNSRNVIYNTNNLVINDGVNIIVTDDYNSDLYALYNYGSSAKTTMNGGLIKVTNNSTLYASSAIGVVQSDSLFELKGGTIELISSVDSAGIVEGTVDFSGGTIKAANGLSDNREITMSGGKIISSNTGIKPYMTVQSVVITGGEIESESTGINQGGWGTYTIDGLKITAGETCIDLDITTMTINSGTYNCGAGGINTRRGSNVTINGGTFTTVGDGIVTNGDNPTITILGGSIVSSDGYGIYQKVGTTVLGSNDNLIDTGSPLIQGLTYGWYISGGTANFYDGILKGQTKGYTGLLTNIADDSIINEETEMIDELEYNNAYLINQGYVVRNDNKTDNNMYKNLQTAIDDATSGDSLELLDNASVYYTLIIPEGKTINLDMKGYSIALSKSITNGGILNLTDSSLNKTSLIKCGLGINLIVNNGTLNVNYVDINYTSNATSVYPLINNGISKLIGVSISRGYYGIKNNINAKLDLEDTDITAINTAIYNNGEIHVDGGTIDGTSYGIYNSISNDSSIKNATINSNNNIIYNDGNTYSTIVNNCNMYGGTITNNSGELNITKGLTTSFVVNKAIASISEVNMGSEDNIIESSYYINNFSQMILNKVIIHNLNSSWSNYGSILNSGSLSISSSEINTLNAGNYSSTTWSTASAIYNNGGSVTSNNNAFTLGEMINKTNSIIRLAAIRNDSNGSLDSDSDRIIISENASSYGIYNLSQANSNTISNITIDIDDVINGYGIYSNNGEITLETGTVDVNANNAYGIYIDGDDAVLTLGTLDGRGIKTADMSTTDPEIKAMGSTLGVGVKIVNGDFNFYDGRLIGSTYAKPETANLVETKFEARYFLVHDDDTETEIPFGDEAGRTYKYEYCILEFLE